LIFTDSTLSVYFLRVLQGFGLSGFSTALGTVLSDVVPPKRLSEGVGYYGLSGTVAMALGPMLSLYLLETYDYNITFIVTVIIALLSGLATLYLRYEKKLPYSSWLLQNKESKRKSVKKKSGPLSFIEPSSIRPCIITFLFILPISSVFTFMPLFALERNIEDIGLFFTVYSIAMIITRLVTGKIADRYGYFVVFMPTLIITCLLFVTLAFAWSLPAVLLAGVFYGVGFAGVHPTLNTLVIRLSPQDSLGAANATFYATMDIGFAIGALMWGAISQAFGFTLVFLIGAGIIGISILVYFVVLHGHLQKLGVK